ncbi:RcpC/CpaB family pilus assembly protein [Actinomadura sp. ATCC 31491]|uniref:RcpC/CpaB family pilus assembly protein n=1 Tax=Actinomadura luzonensis TaxID=2805427 RepID=A0ABT0FLW1_9ACTN|nr:RcpC/CpaB family pilus assembly protein [Actinomadura luzonensis]MCK2213320.1 RcpC/CpaB family pilus assembly protein [Actinomadura luzonensis]
MITSWLARYGRRRRLIAAALAALAVLSAYVATRPTPPTTVLVAAHDLPAGPVTAADLTPVALDHPPAGAIRRLSPATPHHLTSPMRRGEPLTDARLLKTAYTRLPPGMVATPIRIDDPEVAALLSPGSTINLLATWPDATAPVPARTVAEAVTVITIPPPPPPRRTPMASSTTPRGTLLLLATTTTTAAALATAQATARLSITLPAPTTTTNSG